MVQTMCQCRHVMLIERANSGRICQCSAEPQLEVCSAVHPSSLCPLAAFASWALQGYACIQVKGHSLPVVLL